MKPIRLSVSFTFQHLLGAAVVLFLFFSSIAAADPIQTRCDKFLQTHPNRTVAERIVKNGLQKLQSACLEVCPANADSKESPNRDFFNNAVRQLDGKGKDNALAFLNQKFHKTTERDVVLSMALPSFWHAFEHCGSLRRSVPNSPPSIMLRTSSLTAAVLSTSPTLTQPAGTLSETELPKEKETVCYFCLSGIRFTVNAAQRSLPLLI